MSAHQSPIFRINRYLDLAKVALRPEDRRAKLRARSEELRKRTSQLIAERTQRSREKQRKFGGAA